MRFELPRLPYDFDALEPFVSARTMSCHYGQCHRGYIERLNEGLKQFGLPANSVSEVVQRTAGNENLRHVYENAAQSWNHAFFWNCMAPKGGGTPPDRIAAEIDRAFGSLVRLKNRFVDTALHGFGVGYVWLVQYNGDLHITRTDDADPPFMFGQKPLICCDIWEHAYFLDYQAARGEYVCAFLDHLVDWRFAETRLAAAALQPQMHATG